MRKLLVSLACAAAAIPAVALAADDDVTVTGTTPRADERLAEAHVKGHAVRRELAERRERAKERRRQRRLRAAGGGSAQGGGAASPALQAIAACESGGDPHAVGGGGAYRGKYQFDYGTWASVGGSGDPAAASEAEQDRRAAALYARSGSAPWPVCGS
ncbi:MAG TPA: transglycosylase family protein [Thermoleophilaceae bacterium]|jgi:hypothetical protein